MCSMRDLRRQNFLPAHACANPGGFKLDPRLRGCVMIQKIGYFLTVMPDLIRHPDA